MDIVGGYSVMQFNCENENKLFRIIKYDREQRTPQNKKAIYSLRDDFWNFFFFYEISHPKSFLFILPNLFPFS